MPCTTPPTGTCPPGWPGTFQSWEDSTSSWYISQGPPHPVTTPPGTPARSRLTARRRKRSWGREEEEDEESEFIVNRIQGEVADEITWEEMERVTSQDSTLQAVMEDIKKGSLRKEARALGKRNQQFCLLCHSVRPLSVPAQHSGQLRVRRWE